MSEFQLDNKYKAIVIGGSAGSFQPVTNILANVTKDFPIPIFLCLHRLKYVRHGFIEALSIRSNKSISEPIDKEAIKNGNVYLAPANYHMSIELDNTFSLSTERVINNSRPSIDVTFESASYVYRNTLIGILLSGANKDGAYGMAKIKGKGGLTVVQNPEESMINTMPNAALNLVQIDYCLTIDKIIELLSNLRQITKSQ